MCVCICACMAPGSKGAHTHTHPHVCACVLAGWFVILSALSGRMRRRWDWEAGAEWGRDGFRKNTGKQRIWERNVMPVIALQSHKSTVLRQTHRLSHRNRKANSPRKSRGERYSSHCNYLLSSVSLHPSVSLTNTERLLHTKHFFSFYFLKVLTW